MFQKKAPLSVFLIVQPLCLVHILNGGLTFTSFRVSKRGVLSEDIINREPQRTGFMDTGSGPLLNVPNKFHKGVSQISESFSARTIR